MMIGLRIAVLAASLAASTAGAVVVFEEGAGLGSVDLRDVQIAFGWDPATVQKNARDVGFSADVRTEHRWDCVWTTGGMMQTVPRQTVVTERRLVESLPRYGQKNPNQIDGYILSGYSRATSSGQQGVGECLSVNPGARSVNRLSQPSGGAELYVAYPAGSSNRVLLRRF